VGGETESKQGYELCHPSVDIVLPSPKIDLSRLERPHWHSADGSCLVYGLLRTLCPASVDHINHIIPSRLN